MKIKLSLTLLNDKNAYYNDEDKSCYNALANILLDNKNAYYNNKDKSLY